MSKVITKKIADLNVQLSRAYYETKDYKKSLDCSNLAPNANINANFDIGRAQYQLKDYVLASKRINVYFEAIKCSRTIAPSRIKVDQNILPMASLIYCNIQAKLAQRNKLAEVKKSISCLQKHDIKKARRHFPDDQWRTELNKLLGFCLTNKMLAEAETVVKKYRQVGGKLSAPQKKSLAKLRQNS